jgi:hypothetical protein
MQVTPIDSTSISVAGRTLSAGQVDQLLQDLAEARDALSPDIPRAMRNVASSVFVQHDPDFQIGVLPGGSIAMGLRHRGQGWFLFSLGIKEAALLRDFLLKETAGIAAFGYIEAIKRGPHGPH